MKQKIKFLNIVCVLWFSMFLLNGQRIFAQKANIDWQINPTSFAKLLMGENFVKKPTKENIIISTPDSIRKQIIGAQVTWKVFRRASPFPTGPRTLPATGIFQDGNLSGLLIVMPRVKKGDNEVCEAPYQNTPIDDSIKISGKISSFSAGTRADGNMVIVVDIIDVPGCNANRSLTDLSGIWNHERSGGRTSGTVKGNITLVRDKAQDSEGYRVFSGLGIYDESEEDKKKKATDSTASPKKWLIGVKGNQALVVLGSSVITCLGSLTDINHIVVECKFLDMSIGTLKLSRQ